MNKNLLQNTINRLFELNEEELKIVYFLISAKKYSKEKSLDDSIKSFIEANPSIKQNMLKIIVDKSVGLYETLNGKDKGYDWETLDGQKLKFEDMSNNHLINIYWYFLIFKAIDYRYTNLSFSRELSKRKIDVQKTKYKPILKKEQEFLIAKGYAKRYEANTYIIMFDNEVIGMFDFEN